MRLVFVFAFFLWACPMAAQGLEPQEEVLEFQEELNDEYKNPKTSPLDADKIKTFQHHDFFPIGLQYRVVANFKRLTDEKPFDMVTTKGTMKHYIKYGVADFELDGKHVELTLYQSPELTKQKKYRDYLFLPFRDLTNGDETYEGGRYIDMKIPKGDVIVIDFNRAYNPYCAYSNRFACPVTPEENRLPMKIPVGVRLINAEH